MPNPQASRQNNLPQRQNEPLKDFTWFVLFFFVCVWATSTFGCRVVLQGSRLLKRATLLVDVIYEPEQR